MPPSASRMTPDQERFHKAWIDPKNQRLIRIKAYCLAINEHASDLMQRTYVKLFAAGVFPEDANVVFVAEGVMRHFRQDVLRSPGFKKMTADGVVHEEVPESSSKRGGAEALIVTRERLVRLKARALSRLPKGVAGDRARVVLEAKYAGRDDWQELTDMGATPPQISQARKFVKEAIEWALAREDKEEVDE